MTKYPRVVSKKQLYQALNLVYISNQSGRLRYRHLSIRRDYFTDDYIKTRLQLDPATFHRLRTINYFLLKVIVEDFDIAPEELAI